ncbi:MAG: SUMF1/EgtB/PvdO family nonheme iron enzyme [Candidatus Cloacimonetes bacterium]|nr:SUMF1/EgtB/PvdO family nonheme iron enzyme [Candidatus Cloacimonadota bacterium]
MNLLKKILTLSILLVNTAFATNDDFFHYNGLFVDQNQQALLGTSTDSITVSLYSTPTNGVAQYSQVFSAVKVINGAFQLKIGPSLPNLNEYKYLELNINNSALPLSPRIEIQTQAKVLESNKVGGFTVQELINQLQSASNSPNSTQNVQKIVQNFQVSNQLTANHIVNESIVTKSIKLEANNQTCSTDTEGTIRYNFVSKNVEFCDGFSFRSINAPQSTKIVSITPFESRVSIGWHHVAGTTKYRLYYDLDETVTESSNFIETHNNGYYIENLQNWSQYHFAVQSFDQNGKSQLSPIESIQIGKVIDHVAIIPTQKAVKLNWEPTDQATSYTVFYEKSPEVSTNSTNIVTVLPTISISSLEQSTMYYFKVQANKNSKTSSLSTTFHAIQLPRWIEPTFDVKMIKIPNGSFYQGNNQNNSKITISKDFYISTYEVTQKLWKSVTGNQITSEYSVEINDNHPISNITRDQIVKVGGFLDLFNQRIGCQTSNFETDHTRYHPANIGPGCFRLPTNAEWEYMATYALPKDDRDFPLNQYMGPKYQWQVSHDIKFTSVYNLLPTPGGLYHLFGNSNEFIYDTLTNTERNFDLAKLYTSPIDPVLNYHSPNEYLNYNIIRGVQPYSMYTERSRSSKAGFRLLATLPSSPTKVTIKEITPTYKALNLSWSTSVAADKYEITFDTNSSFSKNPIVLTTTSTQIYIDQLINDTNYYFKIRSLQGNLASLPSKVVSASPKLEIVQNISGQIIDGQINLQWDHNPHASAYDIYRVIDSSSIPNLVASTSLNHVLITNLTDSKNYKFIVQAKTNLTQSHFSKTISVGLLPNFIEPVLNYQLVLLPAGSTRISYATTANPHLKSMIKTLTLTKSVYIGKFELTQSQWASVISTINWQDPQNPPTTNSNYVGNDLPAFGVSIAEVVGLGGFLDKVNTAIGCNLSRRRDPQTGRTYDRYHPRFVPPGCYRLPTTQEWEYMAYTNQSDKPYLGLFNSNSNFSDSAWYLQNSSQALHPVGNKLPNNWGVYDVIGNISEFVRDPFLYFDSYSNAIKGGSIYSTEAYQLLPTYIKDIAATTKSNMSGIRLVFVAP